MLKVSLTRNCARVETGTYESKTLVDDDSDLFSDTTWNKRIAFVHLNDGCYLVGYQHHNMEGEIVYLVKRPHYLEDHYWAYVIEFGGNLGEQYTNWISGYWCRCTK